MLLLDHKRSLDDLAFESAISRITLEGILKGKVEAGNDVLEKFYSYLYRNKYRVNLGIEQIVKESSSAKIFFHGSKDGIKEITPNGSRSRCDFGPGFYVGESFFQAASFISDQSAGNVYLFSANVDGLKIKSFEVNSDWMMNIALYRGRLHNFEHTLTYQRIADQIKDADIIIAPIADNKMMQILLQFERGDITSKEAEHALCSSDLGNQYVFKTQKAIDRLKPLMRLYLCEEEKKDYLNQNKQRALLLETKLRLSKKEYRGKGLFIDEVFEDDFK